ncbi:MAG: sugar kinase [Propylenella sp.]
MKPATFASIGECMIELSGRGDDLWQMGFAGDTFNTAWYARAVLPKERRVAYVTALGDDPFSERMRAFIADAGVETERIRTVAGRRPGLYAITLDKGERSFTYWRGESAARRLVDDSGWLDEALAGADLLYFSGITLGILSPDARRRLLDAIAAKRRMGARVAFDPNFRAALWPDLEEARAAIEASLRVADFALPTFDDEAKLFGDASIEATADRIGALGVGEIVVKNGSEPCLVAAEGRRERIPTVRPEKIVDTTGAGDSFGGAYLAARLIGRSPTEAARLGHRVAAQVVGVHGALAKIDRQEALKSRETG